MVPKWIESLKKQVALNLHIVEQALEKISSNKYVRPAAFSGLFLLTLVWAWCLLHYRLGSHFSQDSYAYYLLGRNIFDGLGYTTPSARDLSVEPIWPVLSKSFPPLHPLLVGFVDAVSDLHIRSASFVTLLYLMGTIIVIVDMGRDLDKKTWLFIFAGFVLTVGTNRFYREEMEAGRSIPGMMLFFLLGMLFYMRLLSDKTRKIKFEVLCGVMLAAMLHQRFDQTLFCLGFFFFSIFVFRIQGLTWKEALIRTGTIAGTFTLVSMPWAIRNIIHFGAPFASDNTGSVLSTYRGLFCATYWLPGQEPPTVFTNPDLWIDLRLKFLLNNLKKVVTITHHGLYIAPLVVLSMWMTYSFKQRVFIFFAGMHILTTLVTISLTPYGDHRYFSLVHLNVYLVLGMSVGNLFKLSYTRRLRWLVQAAMVIAFVYVTAEKLEAPKVREDLLSGNIIPQTTAKRVAIHKRMRRVLGSHVKKKDPIFAVKPHAELFSLYTGYRTTYYPSTCLGTRKGLAAFIKEWKVDYMLIPKYVVKRLRLHDFVIANVMGRPLVGTKAYVESIKKERQRIRAVRERNRAARARKAVR